MGEFRYGFRVASDPERVLAVLRACERHGWVERVGVGVRSAVVWGLTALGHAVVGDLGSVEVGGDRSGRVGKLSVAARGRYGELLDRLGQAEGVVGVAQPAAAGSDDGRGEREWVVGQALHSVEMEGLVVDEETRADRGGVRGGSDRFG